MLRKCKQLVDEAAKKLGLPTPTEAQYQRIEDLIASQMRELGRRDPAAWQALSRDQQFEAAARAAMEEIQAKAQRKLENAERQVLREAETETRLQELQQSFKDTKGHDGTRAEALKHDFNLAQHTVTAERKIAQASLMDLIQAVASTKGVSLGRSILMRVFDAENPVMTRDIAREIFRNADGHTGNEAAKIAAKAWLDTIEGLRARFNAAGGDVGKLEYGYLPNMWDTSKVRAKRDGLAEFLMDKVDRRRYLREDGSLMNDTELFNFLNQATETLATNGLNKREPGSFTGSGSRANRGSDHRVIHFKDGDAWAAVMAEYGRGSMYDAMMGHVSGMTRDIVLVERYGPDANANARLQFDLAARADGTDPGKLVGKGKINPETYWDILTGKVGAPVDESLARTGEMVRNLQTAAKLGGAVISSVTDLGTLAITTGYNRLPYWQLVKDIGSQISPFKNGKEARQFMSAHGMIAESVASALNRWSGDNLGSNWSGKLANSMMRLSLLNAWTDGLRQGFTMTMNAGLARMAKKEWSRLNEFDRSRLTRAGFNEADWKVLNATPPTNFKGRELLTPQSIKQAADPVYAMDWDDIKPGTWVRLYHGTDPAQNVGTGGGWWTTNKAKAERYGAVDEVTLPAEVVARHATRGHNGADEFVFAARMPSELAQGVHPPSVAEANALASKLFGFIHDESEYAVVNPDMRTRAIVTAGGTQAGTYSGEIARTVMQFKSFPIAMMTRHWGRMFEGNHDAAGAPLLANRAVYGMALLVTGLGLGAIATQEKQLLQGKDPIDMTKPRFWAKALAQGGGFGIAGDLFLIDPANSATDSATTAIKNLAGPTVGSAAELTLKVITENIWQAAEGKDTHWEAELFNWAKGQTPGASLWWMRPMLDHGFANALNESMSPGYLARVQQRAAKDWGQKYWWSPRDTLPARAPDLAAAGGR